MATTTKTAQDTRYYRCIVTKPNVDIFGVHFYGKGQTCYAIKGNGPEDVIVVKAGGQCQRNITREQARVSLSIQARTTAEETAELERRRLWEINR